MKCVYWSVFQVCASLYPISTHCQLNLLGCVAPHYNNYCFFMQSLQELERPCRQQLFHWNWCLRQSLFSPYPLLSSSHPSLSLSFSLSSSTIFMLPIFMLARILDNRLQSLWEGGQNWKQEVSGEKHTYGFAGSRLTFLKLGLASVGFRLAKWNIFWKPQVAISLLFIVTVSFDMYHVPWCWMHTIIYLCIVFCPVQICMYIHDWEEVKRCYHTEVEEWETETEERVLKKLVDCEWACSSECMWRTPVGQIIWQARQQPVGSFEKGCDPVPIAKLKEEFATHFLSLSCLWGLVMLSKWFPSSVESLRVSEF